MRRFFLFFFLLLAFSADAREIFFVPGWRTGFDARTGSVNILKDIFPGVPVTVKSWNSDVSFPEADKNADVYAETLIAEILAMPEARRRELILVGHSLGARIVVETLDVLAKKNLSVCEVALLGAAINWDDARIANGMNAVKTRCWNVYSPNDLLLALYPIAKWSKPLGQVGWSQKDPRFLEREMKNTMEHYAYLYLLELGRFRDTVPDWREPPVIDPCQLEKVVPARDTTLYWRKEEECAGWLLLAHKTGSEYRIVDPEGMIRAAGDKESVEKEFQKLREYHSAGTK